MLIKFFFMLREGGLKVSVTEMLTLLEALESGIAGHSVDDFYYLSRAALVKDESQFDRFDRSFCCALPGRGRPFPGHYGRHSRRMGCAARLS